MAYLWCGFGCNSPYIETIKDIDLNVLNHDAYLKYQVPVINKNGVKIAAPDLRKEHQVEFLEVLSSSHRSLDFRNKDLRRLFWKRLKNCISSLGIEKIKRARSLKKLQSSHYHKLIKQGYIWIFYLFLKINHLSRPLLSGSYRKTVFTNSDQTSVIEGAYSDINRAVALITSEFKLAS